MAREILAVSNLSNGVGCHRGSLMRTSFRKLSHHGSKTQNVCTSSIVSQMHHRELKCISLSLITEVFEVLILRFIFPWRAFLCYTENNRMSALCNVRKILKGTKKRGKNSCQFYRVTFLNLSDSREIDLRLTLSTRSEME